MTVMKRTNCFSCPFFVLFLQHLVIFLTLSCPAAHLNLLYLSNRGQHILQSYFSGINWKRGKEGEASCNFIWSHRLKCSCLHFLKLSHQGFVWDLDAIVCSKAFFEQATHFHAHTHTHTRDAGDRLASSGCTVTTVVCPPHIRSCVHTLIQKESLLWPRY